ncbi:MAG: hypothetical protein CMP11_03900 [Zetaproteobacteria bacterium]|nr:hypothetical protein [Pseudobdellovibrionaceae bacterium]
MLTIIHLSHDDLLVSSLKNHFSINSLELKDKVHYQAQRETNEIFDTTKIVTAQILIIDSSLLIRSIEKKLIHFKLSQPKVKIIILSYNENVNSFARYLNLGINDIILRKTKIELMINRIISIVNCKPQRSISEKLKENYVGETLRETSIKIEKILYSSINSVLVTGETGTGKEMVADCLSHFLPKTTPLLRINCASLSNDLANSELFGYRKGAFTGAAQNQEGIFEKADGGWIFFDEIARLNLDSQAKILRTLESGEVRQVGSYKNKKVNVRILAATNESLEYMVSKGTFRQDLYERLRTYEIELPALRNRSQEEVGEILDFWLKKINENAKEVIRLSPEVHLLLLSYSWKYGNIRELRNLLRSLSICDLKEIITIDKLPEVFKSRFYNQFKEKLKKTNTEKEKEEETFPISFHAIEDTLFLNYLEKLSETTHPQKLSQNKIAKAFNMTRWKCLKKLKSIKESGKLPRKYEHLS